MNDMNEEPGNSGQLPPDAVGGGGARFQFEAWRKSLIARPNLMRNGEYYEDYDTQIAWSSWQAALAAPQPVGVEPAPAAVPVDERQDAAIVEAAKLAYGLLWMGSDLSGPHLAHRARVALRDALGKRACGEGINAARATHPQPPAARGDA